ncbi:MAG: exosortase/archaeosortase family protein [Kiritimatiellaeota bacterium]|nr:exosortase/archaeosortase family protein [Kiritimatiellota bacterium]
MNWLRWCVVLLLLLAGWLHYRVMLAWTVAAIRDPFEDPSIAWVFPLVSLFDIWLNRGAFRKAAGVPSPQGFAWVAAFIALAWSGARYGLILFEQVSLIGLIWSVPYALWGRGVGRLMLFPAWYLVFSLPVSRYLETLTPHLRTLAAGTVAGLLNWAGIDLLCGGTRIFYGGSPDTMFGVDVADPCSGIRSLFSLTSGAAAYAHFCRETRRRRWMLLVCSFPVAILGNILRILSICVVGIIFGKAAAMGWFHDCAGQVFFFIALALLFLTERCILRLILWLRSLRCGRP